MMIIVVVVVVVVVMLIRRRDHVGVEAGREAGLHQVVVAENGPVLL